MQRNAAFVLVIPLFSTLWQINAEGVQEELSKEPISVTTFCRSMPDWTHVADPTNCRKFHACVGKTSQEFECAEHFHFDRTTLRCMPGECQASDENTCRNHEALAVPNDCHKFTYCTEGRRELRECPMNFYFDSETKICKKQVSSPDFHCRCGGLPSHSTFANEAKCDTYFRCADDRAMLFQCPMGQYYNASINSCLQDYDGICLKKTNNTFCKGLGDGFRTPLFQALPEDCTKFQICVFGRVFTQECQKNHYYDPETNFCRFNWGHKCSRQPIEAEQEMHKPQPLAPSAQNHTIAKTTSTIHNVVVYSKEKPIKMSSHLRYDKFSSRFIKYKN